MIERLQQMKLVPLQGKTPTQKNWTEGMELPPDYQGNIGLVLGPSDVADIDLDDCLAVELAQHLNLRVLFGPAPYVVFGRKSKPISHIFVRQKHVRSASFKDPETQKLLVEVRGNNQQTMIPPSTHPSGEPLIWGPGLETFLAASPTDQDVAEIVGKMIAACTVLAARWEAGSRNQLAMAVAGWWAKLGWSQDVVAALITAICRTAGDTDLHNRLDAVEATFRRLADAEQLTGAKRLQELLGKKVAKWLLGLFKVTAPQVDDLYLLDMVVKHNTLRICGNVWLHWDGVVWRKTTGALLLEVQELIQEFIQLTAIAPPPEAARYAEVVDKLSNVPAIKRLEYLLKSSPHVAIDLQDLDAQPHILGCPNGYVDLRTGECMAPDPDLLVSRLTSVPYDPDAEAPVFVDMLHRATGSDELVDYIQLLLGISLVGHPAKLLPVVYGPTDSGKTTFLTTAVHNTLGDYAVEMPAEALSIHSRQAQMWIASAAGARITTISEPPRNLVFNPAFIKTITGGNRLVARALYAMPTTITTSFTVWVDTNFRPEFTESDAAIWRRLRPIEFKNSVVLQEGQPGFIPHFDRVLLEQRPGILAWMVKGAVKALSDWEKWIRYVPAQVSDSVEEWNLDTDTLTLFLSSLEKDSDATISVADLYRYYVLWCEAQRTPPIGRNNFSMELQRLGYYKKKLSDNKWYWIGLRLTQNTEVGF